MVDSESIVKNILGVSKERNNKTLTKKMYSDNDDDYNEYDDEKDQEGLIMTDLSKAKSEEDTKVQDTVNKEANENEQMRNRAIKNIIG